MLEEQQRNKNFSSIKYCTRSSSVLFLRSKENIFNVSLQISCVTACVKFIGLVDHVFVRI